MAANQYDIGALVQITGTFQNIGGALTDPTQVAVRVVKPSGTAVSPDPTPTRASTGVYTATVSPAAGEDGVWRYLWQGKGAVQAAGEREFIVRKATVSRPL